MILEKKGEIKSFTDQVRVICVKNSIDKPTLGEKIGLDNKAVFTAIKNNTFKPEPKVYFKLETYICGKNSRYKNKLRSKYEKTLDVTEWSEYVKESSNLAKPKEIKFSAPKNVIKEEDKEEMRLIIDKPDSKLKSVIGESMDSKEKTISERTIGDVLDTLNDEQKVAMYAVAGQIFNDKAIKPIKTGKTDKEAKIRFYNILMKNKDAGISVAKLDNTILGHKIISNMAKGWSFIPTDKLKEVLSMAKIEEGSEAWQKLVELQLSCIAGPKEDEELSKYERIFGSGSVEPEKKEETKEEVVMEKEVGEVSLKGFSDILTKWLFMKGYTLKQAARTIGCSEQELKNVINGDICLSPYHVNRFKDTIRMDSETIDKLVTIANVCYKGHEVSKTILDYISSDATIISTLEEIARQNKPAQFWDDIWSKL